MSKPAGEDRIEEYLAYARAHPELFATPPGGVRILLQRSEIEAVERGVARDLAARGLDPRGAEVGVVLRDPWFTVLRDAVEFSEGSRRTHARVLNRSGNGVAALPLYQGRIVLLRHFRHPPRRWMLEIPRGGIEPGEPPEDTVRRELHEEMEGQVSSMQRLGLLYGVTNLYWNCAHLYLAELTSVGNPQVGEGIAGVEQVSAPEFERLLLEGEIVDSFTVAAFTHARLRGLV